LNAVSNDRRPKRKYELKARAERQRRTRDRIVAATVALHESVGPARTTIADIARRAGVQRLTVYNTFPDTRDLFRACQGRFLADNPPPDLTPRAGTDPLRELGGALRRLYAWYRATERMERHVHRDRHLVPALDELMTITADVRLAAMADAHAAAIARRRAPGAPIKAFVHLAFQFHTWEVLAQGHLTDDRMARLMTAAVRAAAHE
jgi:AcrR family transcriptional regulator